MNSKDQQVARLDELAIPPVALHEDASDALLKPADRTGKLTKLRIGDFVLHVSCTREAGAFALPIEDTSHLLVSVARGAATVLASTGVDMLVDGGDAYLFSGETIEQIFVLPETSLYVLEISEKIIAPREALSSGYAESKLVTGTIRGARGRAIANCLALVVRVLEGAGGENADSLANALLDTTVDMKLMAQRPRTEPVNSAGQIIPGAVRRAIRYIHQEAVNGVRAPQVAQYAGMSLRSLQNGFSKFVGITPAAYITRTRLLGVKQGLQDGTFKSVAEAARHWGFSSASHFSQRYLEAFGEKPSHTKRGR